MASSNEIFRDNIRGKSFMEHRSRKRAGTSVHVASLPRSPAIDIRARYSCRSWVPRPRLIRVPAQSRPRARPPDHLLIREDSLVSGPYWGALSVPGSSTLSAFSSKRPRVAVVVQRTGYVAQVARPWQYLGIFEQHSGSLQKAFEGIETAKCQ